MRNEQTQAAHLDVVEQLGEAPVHVGLDLGQGLHAQTGHHVHHRALPFYPAEVLGQEDEDERRDEVVHALHVAGRRVADCPHVQDALHEALDRVLVEERQLGLRAGKVHLDLPQDLL